MKSTLLHRCVDSGARADRPASRTGQARFRASGSPVSSPRSLKSVGQVLLTVGSRGNPAQDGLSSNELKTVYKSRLGIKGPAKNSGITQRSRLMIPRSDLTRKEGRVNNKLGRRYDYISSSKVIAQIEVRTIDIALDNIFWSEPLFELMECRLGVNRYSVYH